jgi:hypothetical protein
MIVFRWGLYTTRLAHAQVGAAGRCGQWCERDRWEPAEPIARAASRRGFSVGVSSRWWWSTRVWAGSRGGSRRLGGSRAGAGKSGDTGGVAGMRITLSGAMRARDVSRPTDEQLEAAGEREARITRSGRPSGASSARGGVGPGGASGGVGPGGAAPVGGVVAATGGPAAPSAAPAWTDQPRTGPARTGPAGSSPARADPAGTAPARAEPSGSAGGADGAGRDGSPAHGGADDEVPLASRRRRRRRGR